MLIFLTIRAGSGPNEIDRQQIRFCNPAPKDLHAIGENEGSLELPRGNAAIEIFAVALIDLAATDDKLVFLGRDVELFFAETGDRQRNAQPFRRVR